MDGALGLNDLTTSVRVGGSEVLARLVPPGAQAEPGGFEAALDKARRGESSEDALRADAERFIAGALVYPVLKQLRETNNAAAPFAPGEAEKSFGWMFDQYIADEIVSSQNFPLVDAVMRTIRPAGEQSGGPNDAA
ncbi:MAG: hypothetical protein AAGD00_02840 [Planctomycetota bacterium]